MKLVIANFKSNKNQTEYEHWLEAFGKYIEHSKPKSKVVLAPSTPFLSLFAAELNSGDPSDSVSLGIQDLSNFPAGAYTGATCTRNLESFNVTHAILGHNERRHYFHETNIEIAAKVHEALSAQITPIVCVSASTLQSQANALEPSDRKQIIVAFEPIENIGTGHTDTLEDILEKRTMVKDLFGDVPYIYGGSVDSKSNKELLTHPEIDGFLVGTASLNVDAFTSLLNLIP